MTDTPSANGYGRNVKAEWLWRGAAMGLLGVAVYFVMDVHGDVKKQSAAIGDLRTEIAGKSAVLSTQVESHERRLGKLEDWRTSQPTRGNP